MVGTKHFRKTPIYNCADPNLETSLWSFVYSNLLSSLRSTTGFANLSSLLGPSGPIFSGVVKTRMVGCRESNSPV